MQPAQLGFTGIEQSGDTLSRPLARARNSGKDSKKIEKICKSALEYWAIRDTGRVDDERTLAHNDLLDKLTGANVRFFNREHAAMIGKAIISFCQAVEDLAELDIGVEYELHN